MDTSPGKCWSCHCPTVNGCSKCTLAKYCGPACQNKDRIRHFEECISAPQRKQLCNYCGETVKSTLFSCKICGAFFYCDDACRKNDLETHDEVCSFVKQNVLAIARTLQKLDRKVDPSPHYFGRLVHATDFLKLDNNEKDIPRSLDGKPFTILIYGADLKHLLMTFSSLPKHFSQGLHTTLVETSIHLVSRNVLLLFLMQKCQETSPTIRTEFERLTYICYSIKLDSQTFSFLLQGLEMLRSLTYTDFIKQVGEKISLNERTFHKMQLVWDGWWRFSQEENALEKLIKVRTSKISYSTIQKTISKITDVLPKQHVRGFHFWLNHGSFENQAEDSYANVTMTSFNPFNEDHVKAFTDIKTDSLHKFGVFENDEKGDLMIYSPNGLDLIFRDWDYCEVAKESSLDNDVLVLYKNYIDAVFQKAAVVLNTYHNIKISFILVKNEDSNPSKVLNTGVGNRFDRICSGLLADTIGVPTLIETLGPLLNKENPHACLITHHRLWSSVVENRNSTLLKTELINNIRLEKAVSPFAIISTKLAMFRQFLQAEMVCHYSQLKINVEKKRKIPSFTEITEINGLKMSNFLQYLNSVVPFRLRVEKRLISMADSHLYTLEWRNAEENSIQCPSSNLENKDHQSKNTCNKKPYLDDGFSSEKSNFVPGVPQTLQTFDLNKPFCLGERESHTTVPVCFGDAEKPLCSTCGSEENKFKKSDSQIPSISPRGSQNFLKSLSVLKGFSDLKNGKLANLPTEVKETPQAEPTNVKRKLCDTNNISVKTLISKFSDNYVSSDFKPQKASGGFSSSVKQEGKLKTSPNQVLNPSLVANLEHNVKNKKINEQQKCTLDTPSQAEYLKKTDCSERGEKISGIFSLLERPHAKENGFQSPVTKPWKLSTTNPNRKLHKDESSNISLVRDNKSALSKLSTLSRLSKPVKNSSEESLMYSRKNQNTFNLQRIRAVTNAQKNELCQKCNEAHSEKCRREISFITEMKQKYEAYQSKTEKNRTEEDMESSGRSNQAPYFFKPSKTVTEIASKYEKRICQLKRESKCTGQRPSNSKPKTLSRDQVWMFCVNNESRFHDCCSLSVKQEKSHFINKTLTYSNECSWKPNKQTNQVKLSQTKEHLKGNANINFTLKNHNNITKPSFSKSLKKIASVPIYKIQNRTFLPVGQNEENLTCDRTATFLRMGLSGLENESCLENENDSGIEYSELDVEEAIDAASLIKEPKTRGDTSFHSEADETKNAEKVFTKSTENFGFYKKDTRVKSITSPREIECCDVSEEFSGNEKFLSVEEKHEASQISRPQTEDNSGVVEIYLKNSGTDERSFQDYSPNSNTESVTTSEEKQLSSVLKRDGKPSSFRKRLRVSWGDLPQQESLPLILAQSSSSSNSEKEYRCTHSSDQPETEQDSSVHQKTTTL